MTVDVTFWGVRGSFPCASPRHMAFGGNTSCVSVEVDGQVVILDAGTGMFMLGKYLAKRGVTEATLLMSHTHTDHIVGFPFFAPAWMGARFDLTVMAGHATDCGGIRAVFEMAQHAPLFPVPIAGMGGAAKFVDFIAGDSFKLPPNISIRTCRLNHPNGATGYRVEAKGRSICYVTDTEHYPDRLDQEILELARGADLLIYDSTYSDADYATKIGWGHSTWQEGLKLARAADVGQFCAFHHDPDSTDDVMEKVERELRAAWPEGGTVAREGMTINYSALAMAAE